jgi:hypothetical protein
MLVQTPQAEAFGQVGDVDFLVSNPSSSSPAMPPENPLMRR